MRVALIGEGTYPIVHGGVSTWCDQLVDGLSDHEFHVVTLVGADRELRWSLPGSVASTTLVAMWDPIMPRSRPWRRRLRASVDEALEQVWEAAFTADRDPEALTLAERGLRTLAEAGTALPELLGSRGSAAHVSRAWLRHLARSPIAPAEAVRAGYLADRVLGVSCAPWPGVDLTHVTTNGPAALMALVRRWRDGTPFILTEHGVYVRERYLALADADLPWPVRYAVMSLIRLVCRLAYREAALVTPVSDFNAKWAIDLGASPDRLSRIHNGVDPDAYPMATTEPSTPTVSWVGRVDPLKDLHTLVSAVGHARDHVPGVRLRLYGPVPEGNEWYRNQVKRHIDAQGLADAVTFEGTIASSREAAESGHVVALSSISEGLPFTIVEAMLVGRATVSTDVGGVSEIVGLDGRAGVLVPARDPKALGSALARLLTNDRARLAMVQAGRARALRMFSLDDCLERYRDLYRLLGDAPRSMSRPNAAQDRPVLLSA